MRRCVRLALLLCLSLLLAACRSAVQPDASADERFLPLRITQHQAAVSTLTAFSVGGGIGVWNDTESSSARMQWQQTSGERNIFLTGPAGIGSLRLRTDDGGQATLQIGQKREVTGPSADALLKQVLGLQVTVPLDQLSLWIRGLPGEARNLAYDSEGRLQSLSWRDEEGINWRARIKRYTALDTLQLPSLVTAQGAGYRMRIVLKDWERAPESRGNTDIETDTKEGEPEGPQRLPIPGRHTYLNDGVGSRRG